MSETQQHLQHADYANYTRSFVHAPPPSPCIPAQHLKSVGLKYWLNEQMSKTQPALMEYLFKDSTVKLQHDKLYRHIIECYGSAV